MTQSQESDSMDKIINDLLEKIYNKRITDTAVMPLILSNDDKQADNLRIIDCLHQSVLTSLQFGQYRRAVWYLQAFALACNKTFGDSNTKNIIQSLQKRIQI